MIEIQDLTKSYAQQAVLTDLSFSLAANQTLAILGKSGCGKTTLLKILAGLEQADTGSFKVNKQAMFELLPQKRGVVYLSQEPLLFPHLNIFENLAYGLRLRKFPKSTIKTQTNALAQALGLAEQLAKAPHQLSGGQKQRVSFGRALNIKPQILLLDEPFASLDADTRNEMQKLYQTIKKRYQITSILVTHDLKEALIMGDQIGLMQSGNLTIYKDHQSFLASPNSKAREELDFWQTILKKLQ